MDDYKSGCSGSWFLSYFKPHLFLHIKQWLSLWCCWRVSMICL